MDKESISRLCLDFIKNIDLENSDEIYNPSTNNHIIKLKLNKDDNLPCPDVAVRYNLRACEV